MSARPWTLQEIQTLRQHAKEGVHVIALLTGRSTRSVQRAAERHRISLRRSGEQRGKALGEPRVGSWRTEGLGHVRADVLSGEVSDVNVDAHLQIVAAGRRGVPQQLCPACSARPVQRPRTGLCTPCHLRALAEAHRHAKAEKEARREWWKEKQQIKRRRDDDDARSNNEETG